MPQSCRSISFAPIFLASVLILSLNAAKGVLSLPLTHGKILVPSSFESKLVLPASRSVQQYTCAFGYVVIIFESISAYASLKVEIFASAGKTVVPLYVPSATVSSPLSLKSFVPIRQITISGVVLPSARSFILASVLAHLAVEIGSSGSFVTKDPLHEQFLRTVSFVSSASCFHHV